MSNLAQHHRFSCVVLLTAAVGLSGVEGIAGADVLVPRTGAPLIGRLVERNPRQTVFRERVEPGKYVERRVESDAVLSVIVTIDDERLRELHPDRPIEYVESAERLALVPADAEARDLAIRLSLIGGRFGTGEVRRRALLQLIALARDPEEEIRFRKLAFLSDPGLLTAVLTDRRQVEPPPAPAALQAALQVVRELRQAQNSTAQAELQKGEIQTTLDRWSDLCSLEQLQRFATTRQRSAAELLQLLKLEYALRQAKDGWPARQGDDSWGEQVEQALAFQPTWDNVSEFRTNENQFVDGQWRSQRR